MPGPNYPYTRLDGNQVLQQAFDEAQDRIRVDASVSATIGDITIDGTGPNPSSIQITDGTDTLLINPDGSINANIELDAADGDNVLVVGTEDGTFGGNQRVIKIGTDSNLRVKDEDLIALVTLLNNKFVNGNDIGDVTINNASLAITNPNLDVALSTRASEATLSALNSKFVGGNDIGDVTINNTSLNPVPIDIITANIDIRDLSASQDNVLIAGTENGLTGGQIRYLVNNLRQQIAATHDRTQVITYADAGTKNERITQIDYSSPTFPGVTARKTITYTPVGSGYIPTNITWSIV